MLIFWIIGFVLAGAYISWIGLFFYGWTRTPCRSGYSKKDRTKVSILIPVRNEEASLMRLLGFLTNQDYPQNLIEIIIIDDHSTDLTSDVAKYYKRRHGNLRYIKLEGEVEGKKAALGQGVISSRFPLILTTDADCIPSRQWVKSMVECFDNTDADLLAGPVIIETGRGFFDKFQRLEYFSLLGSSAGSLNTGHPVMCSSANLGFRREAYDLVSQQNKQKISSGDDVFMLLAMHKRGVKNLLFLKNHKAIVRTKAEPGLDDFINQRKRWASKSRHYNSTASVFTALLVFLINFYMVACLFTGLFVFPFLQIAGLLLISKSIIDFPFLWSVTNYFGERKIMKYFPVIQILYIFYISFTAIAAFTSISDWKGRIVKN